MDLLGVTSETIVLSALEMEFEQGGSTKQSDMDETRLTGNKKGSVDSRTPICKPFFQTAAEPSGTRMADEEPLLTPKAPLMRDHADHLTALGDQPHFGSLLHLSPHSGADFGLNQTPSRDEIKRHLRFDPEIVAQEQCTEARGSHTEDPATTKPPTVPQVKCVGEQQLENDSSLASSKAVSTKEEVAINVPAKPPTYPQVEGVGEQQLENDSSLAGSEVAVRTKEEVASNASAKPPTDPQVQGVGEQQLDSEEASENEELASNGACQQWWYHKAVLDTDVQPTLLEDVIGSSDGDYIGRWLTRQSTAAFCRLNAEAAHRSCKRPSPKRKEVWKNVVTYLVCKIKRLAGLVRLKPKGAASENYSLMRNKYNNDDWDDFDLAPEHSQLILGGYVKHDDALRPFHEDNVDLRSPMPQRSMSSENIENIEAQFMDAGVPNFSDQEALVMSREMERLKQSRGGKFAGPSTHCTRPPRDDYAPPMRWGNGSCGTSRTLSLKKKATKSDLPTAGRNKREPSSPSSNQRTPISHWNGDEKVNRKKCTKSKRNSNELLHKGSFGGDASILTAKKRWV